MRQEDLALASGIPLRTIRNLEQDRVRNPGVRHIFKIANALDCKAGSLIEPKWRK